MLISIPLQLKQEKENEEDTKLTVIWRENTKHHLSFIFSKGKELLDKIRVDALW